MTAGAALGRAAAAAKPVRARRFTLGTLAVPVTLTAPQIAALIAQGFTRPMFEINYGFWMSTVGSGYGTRNTGSYCSNIKAAIQAWLDAGDAVGKRIDITLGMGLHFIPLWVWQTYPTLIRFKNDQDVETPLGTANGLSGSVDYIWGLTGELLWKAYFTDVFTYLGATMVGRIRYVRIAAGTKNGELTMDQTGGYSWQGFSRWAQFGTLADGTTNHLASYAVAAITPVVDGGAGFAGKPITNVQVQNHAWWYVQSLIRLGNAQQAHLRTLGFVGICQWMTPGRGLKASDRASLWLMTSLPAGSFAGAAAWWDVVAAGINEKWRAGLHCSSTADGSGTPVDNVAVPGDRLLTPASIGTRANAMSAAAFTQLCAGYYGLQWSWENPGSGTTPSAHYMDLTDAGMKHQARLQAEAGVAVWGPETVSGGQWAHHSNTTDTKGPGGAPSMPASALASEFAPLITPSAPPTSGLGVSPLGTSPLGTG